MKPTDADIWGLCVPCRRWFYCEGWFDPAVDHPLCPVCRSEPRKIVNRSGW